jgi:hypothetical protein
MNGGNAEELMGLMDIAVFITAIPLALQAPCLSLRLFYDGMTN